MIRGIVRTLREIIFTGLLHGWPGRRCPDCGTKPYQQHHVDCPTGAWDGGVWG